jgi:autotransporter family porin
MSWSPVRKLARRLRGLRRFPRPARTFGFASVVLLMAQCGPTECAPAPAPPAPAPAPAPSYFGWIGVGGALPSDADCAASVRRGGAEVRPGNSTYNTTTWGSRSATFPRATGNFTGTTDEIIQWAACKWGFDEDVLRAQVAKESYWTQTNLGDWTTNPANCAPQHPIGANGQCPESVGLMQVRTPFFRDSIEGALVSSAYNLDIALNVWRNCYEGHETWLNHVERGWDYGAGDAWGCIGRWFSGRWHTAPSEEYIAAVQSYLSQRIWEDPGFVNWRP